MKITLDDGYRAMAADKARETEAVEWCSTLSGQATLEAIKELENGGGTSYANMEDAMRDMLKIASGEHD